jgi:hypothetical protein
MGSTGAFHTDAARTADQHHAGGKCACGAKSRARGQSDGECEECKKNRLAGSRAGGRGPSGVPARAHDALRSGGQPLEPSTRTYFESRFGHDFSRVRVHIGDPAAAASRELGARAFTSGNDIVFARGQYAPRTRPGNRLLAHELAHVVQQRGSGGQTPGRIGPSSDALEREADRAASRVSAGARTQIHGAAAGVIQRDLATPPPLVVAEQDDLTDAQIQSAIRFNEARYNAANTRLIQDLVGTEQTGTWSADDIIAIASIQEEYDLDADGKVGDETFRFLNNEQRLEGMSTRTADCLTSFNVNNAGATPIVRDAATNTCTLSGHFRTAAQFSSRCNCSQFEYRQFIRGHFLQNRGGVQVADLGATQFGRLPSRALTTAFQEDGDTTDPTAQNYGHRTNPADTSPEDHYINGAMADDQANGCRYRSEDFPGFTTVPGIPDCRVGDVIDADMTFRGEIQRNGTAIQSRQWSAIRGRFTVR